MDSVQQSAIVEVDVRTERFMKRKYCSDHLKKVKKAKTSDVLSTMKLEGGIYKGIQQSADGEVVRTDEIIKDTMESDANEQMANKDNELNQTVPFKIGDEVLYCISHGDNSKTAKRYGPIVIYQQCGENTCLLAGLKRKYHSNQLQKVMSTPQVKTVCFIHYTI